MVGIPGILGNMISIVVLTSTEMKNSFNLLLSCLAVTDILFNILAISDYAFFRGRTMLRVVSGDLAYCNTVIGWCRSVDGGWWDSNIC